MTLDDRLDALERQQKITNANIDMLVNYVRELAKAHLTEQRIQEIERLAGNGHDTA